MSAIAKYVFDGAEVRVVVGEDGEPRFVAADVCRALGHTNPSVAVSRLDQDERSALSIADPHGREQVTNVVTEAGLYELIMTSRVEGFREAAKLIRAATGANEPEVRALMVRRGWVQRLGSRLAPAHVGELRGYVTTRACEWIDADGTTHVKAELRITPKGVARAIALILATEAA